MRLSSQEVYDKLVNEERILEIEGQIKFFLGDVDIIVRQKDVVGNIMQEWLQGWMDRRNIEYAPSGNTQMPPDFFLNPDDLTTGLLEVKAFNRNGEPGFDIADFRMYAEEIQAKPYMLYVDYLIFGYDMSDEGIVTIKDIWLKKVWEISRRSENYPLNLQVKDGVIHKIRPGIWYSRGNVDYTVFTGIEDFVSAMEETTFVEPRLRNSIAPTWLTVFQRNYRAKYGHELDVPRWRDIKENYNQRSIRVREKARASLEKAKEKVNSLLLKLAQKENARETARTQLQIEKADAAIEKTREQLRQAQEKADATEAAYNALS